MWSSENQSIIKRLQTLQFIIFRKITNFPFYISNLTLHNDLNVPFVRDLAVKSYYKFHNELFPSITERVFGDGT
jgi:hypothetical protein